MVLMSQVNQMVTKEVTLLETRFLLENFFILSIFLLLLLLLSHFSHVRLYATR